MTPAQASQLLDLLRDEPRREQLISALETLRRLLPDAPAAGTVQVPLAAVTPEAAAAAVGGAVVVPRAADAALPIAVVQSAGGVGAPVAVPLGVQAAAPVAAAPAAAATVPVAPVAAAPAPQAAPAERKLPIPLTPDSLGAKLVVDASDVFSQLTAEVIDAAASVTRIGLLWQSVSQIAADPWSRREVIDAASKLVVLFGVVIAADQATRRALRRFRLDIERKLRGDAPAMPQPDGQAPEGRAPEGQGPVGPPALPARRRAALLTARAAVLLLPGMAAVIAGTLVQATPLGARYVTQLVMVAVLKAYVMLRTVRCLTNVLLAPGRPELRVVRLSDPVALSIRTRVSRMAYVTIGGYTLADVGLLLGLYHVVHEALLKIVALISALILVRGLLEHRAVVADLVRAHPDSKGAIPALRNRLAGWWHFIAAFYVLAIWLVWAFDVPDGFSRLLRLCLATTGIVLLVRLMVVRTDRALGGMLTPDPAGGEPLAPLLRRVAPYRGLLMVLATTLWVAAGGVGLLEVMGVDALDWFGGDRLGARLIAALIDMGLAVLSGIVAWEVANAAIQRHLEHLAQSAQAGRSARLRTLVPILRAGVMVTIIIIAGLVVLSEIGVNIAPLLAGAGVLGVAIGFGSQKLVQDIITGLFLLLENAMQVGDVVSLGGLTGTVENLSIRTIRLRALDGSVHIIPFSAVTTVTNQTRDFSYAVLDISVGLDEEPDRITDVLRELARTMRAETRWRSVIRDEIEVMGVDRFIPTAWVMRARVKTLPGQQWAVGRELNRRIKLRFDELAIDSPLTSYKVLGLLPPTQVVSMPAPVS
jgi:small-conductance mechanosensitive channel